MFKKLLATASVATMVASGPSFAADLQTDVDVTLPNVVALYCYDQVNVSVSAANFLTAVGSTVGATGAKQSTNTSTTNATAAAGTWTAALSGLDTESAGSGAVSDDVDLVMTGVCAFRAITTTKATVQIDPIAAGQELMNGTTDKITVGTPVASDDGSTFAASYDVAQANLGFSVIRPITIKLPLDLSAAKKAGTYSSTTAGTFKVTVSAL